ncbi:MAG TPA: twin-arginine translocase TatA/TatE family subunit [Nitrospiria bacterium]|nr:twin-arginine translocase TatA/TatE family subunit [Nitrospiria bacterium]
MFGIGIAEMALIMLIAIIVVGPEKLPEIAKAIGKVFSDIKKATEDVKDTISDETRKLAEAAKLNEIEEEVKKTLDDAQKIEPPDEKEDLKKERV